MQKLPKILAEIVAGDGSSAALLSQLMEAIPQMVWVTGPEGQPEYVNERWRAFTGTEPEHEPFGGLRLIAPEDRERVGEVFANALRAKRQYEIEYRMRHEDGSYRWVLTQAQPIFDKAGNTTGRRGLLVRHDDGHPGA